MSRPVEWTPDRDEQLTRMWKDMVPLEIIALRMGVSKAAITGRRDAIGLPRRQNMCWAPREDEILRDLWGSGKSASEIAAVISGKTRNAVIGRVHRLGLSGRDKPAKPTMARPPRAPKVERITYSKPPKPGPQNRPAVVFEPGTHVINFADAEEVRARKTVIGGAAVAHVIAGAGVESPNARPFLEATKGCKWPLGERGAVMACCNPVAGGSGGGLTYCPGHYAVSVMQNQPQGLRPKDARRFTRMERIDRDEPVRLVAPVSVWDAGRWSEAA